MKQTTRRNFIKSSAAVMALMTPGFKLLAGESKASVVIIGGGFGGASLAKRLKELEPSLTVTLIEPNAEFHTCPFSNFVIGGMKPIESIRFNYKKLKDTMGVRVIQDRVDTVDTSKKEARLSGGQKVKYDFLVVSPGIDFKFDALEGYNANDAETIPHAYKAGSQTLLLRNQLQNMKDGGVFAIIPPPNPFRCPPGPYERVSVIASYFKKHKPKSKILIFDPKENFSKQALFEEGWQKLYSGMINFYSGNVGGKVNKIDVKNRVIFTEFGEEKVDVINYIPPQIAGQVAHASGLTDKSGWCPVNADFSSKIHEDIYVIGDASIGGDMPKSGFSANNQAKFVAHLILARIKDKPKPEVKLVNTCYSYIGDDYTVSVVGVYENADNRMTSVKGAGGTTELKAPSDVLLKESFQAQSWYSSITQEMFG